eukprot:5681190-Prymnesium_polylepis.1
MEMSIDLKILTSRFADHREAVLVRVPMDEGCVEGDDLRNLRDRVRTRVNPRAGHMCGANSCVQTHVRAQ